MGGAWREISNVLLLSASVRELLIINGRRLGHGFILSWWSQPCCVYLYDFWGRLGVFNMFKEVWKLKLGNMLTVTQSKFEFRSEFKAHAFNGCTFSPPRPVGKLPASWHLTQRMCPADPCWNWLRGVVCTLSQKQGSKCRHEQGGNKEGWMELETRNGVGHTNTGPQRLRRVEIVGQVPWMNPDVAGR